MTDKQITINGVDVSWCNLYRDEVSFIGGETIKDVCSIWIWQRDYSGLEPSCVMECHCSDNPNCYYKNWQRKEQECERLKHDNGYEVGALEKTIDNIKAENEKLKEEVQYLKSEIERIGEQ